MKICAVSDLHGFLPPIPSCDLLLIAGDNSPISLSDPFEQRAWCTTRLANWMAAAPAERVVWIAGNHDTWIWEGGVGRKFEALERVTYLQDTSAEVDGLKIYGTPWTAGFGIGASWWAFDLLNGPDHFDPFTRIPDDADIVVTHGPPHGIGDLTLRDERVGSEELYQRLLQVQPKLVISGHIHEDFGVRRLRPGSETIVANVAMLDVDYRPVPEREPRLFEL